MAMPENIVRRLTLIADSKGLSELTRELGQYANTQKVSEETTLALARKFEKLESTVNPLIKAERSLEAGTRTLFNALAQGGADVDRAAQAFLGLKERYDQVARSAKTAADAQVEASKRQREAFISEGKALRELTEWQAIYNKEYGGPSNEHDQAARSRQNAAIADQMRQRFAEEDRARSEAQSEITRRQSVAAQRQQQSTQFQQGIGGQFSGALSGKSAADSAAIFAKELDAGRAKWDELYKLKLKFRDLTREAEADFKAGKIDQDLYRQVVMRAKAEYVRVRDDELGGGRNARLGEKPGDRLALHQARNLGYQVNDILTGAFSGQSMGMIAAQQGGQIYQILSDGPGGAGASVRKLGNYIKDLMTPMTVATLGFAAFGIAAVKAFNDASDRAVALGRAVNGVGAASGLNGQGLGALAAQAAAKSSVTSTATAQQQAAAFAGAGMSASGISALTGDTTDRFAKAFGLSADDALKTLAEAARDPAKGMQDLNRYFGTISDASIQMATRLKDAGDRQAAQKVFIDALNNSLSLVTPQVTALGHASEVVKKQLSDMWTGFGNRMVQAAAFALGVKDPQAEIERARKLVAEGDRTGLGAAAARGDRDSWFSGREGGPIAQYKAAQALLLEEQKKGDKDKLDQEKRTQATLATERANAAAGYLREMFTYEEQRKAIQTRIYSISGSDPSKIDGGSIAKNAEAVSRWKDQLAFLLPPMEQMRLNSALQVQQTLALTLAQRAQVDSTRAYISAMQNGEGQARASLAAELARNQAIADGLRIALDANREARNQSRLANLLPGERAIEEIRIRDQERRRQSEVGANDNVPPMLIPFKTGIENSTSSLQKFIEALNAAAAKLSNGGGLGGAVSGALSGLGNMLGVSSGSGSMAKGAIVDYIRQAAVKAGIDPDIAVRVAMSEGLNTYVGDNGTSFGPFQLHYGNGGKGFNQRGLGNAFTDQTGLDARDPSTVKQQIDFALANAAKSGWGQWYGAAKVGIGAWQGINNGPNMAARTRGANDNTASLELKNNQDQLYTSIVRETNQQIEFQNRLLQTQIDNYGRSTAQVAEATKQRELLNSAERAGLQLTPSVLEGISDTARRFGLAAAAAQNYAEAVQRINDVRSGISDAFSAFTGGLSRGQGLAKSLKSAVDSLSQSLLKMANNLLMSGLFGDKNNSGGLLSGLFKMLLPGGGSGDSFGGNVGADSYSASLGASGFVAASANGNVFSRGNIIPFARGGGRQPPDDIPNGQRWRWSYGRGWRRSDHAIAPRLRRQAWCCFRRGPWRLGQHSRQQQRESRRCCERIPRA